jgi:hypothetical protein
VQTRDPFSEWARRLPILIVSAADDELVPPGQAEIFENMCTGRGFNGRHETRRLWCPASARSEGQSAIIRFLKRVSMQQATRAE